MSSKKGISSYQLAKDLNVTQKSAWFMLQRIRYAMQYKTFMKPLEGTIELDETFVGGKNKNRHFDKKVKYSQGRSFKDKTPVFGMLERGGELRCVVIPDTKADSIQPIIYNNIKQGSTVYTDEWWAYKGLNNDYIHGVVDHGRGQYKNGDVCTNTIEGFWSHLKRGINGVYHQVSRKHLQKYADEFTFRYNVRDKFLDNQFYVFLSSINDKRLTYSNLIK
jgi:transposase-like protein